MTRTLSKKVAKYNTQNVKKCVC